MILSSPLCASHTLTHTQTHTLAHWLTHTLSTPKKACTFIFDACLLFPFTLTRFAQPMRKFTVSVRQRKTRKTVTSEAFNTRNQEEMQDTRSVIPFPGKSARFEVAHCWNMLLSSCMHLTSVTAGSFLNQVCAFWDRDGTSIVLLMSCAPEAEDSFQKYVSDTGFEPQVPRTTFYARAPKELKWVLSVLAGIRTAQTFCCGDSTG